MSSYQAIKAHDTTMNRTTYTIIYIGALLLFLFHLPNVVLAKTPEATIRVSPIIITLPLSPGKTMQQEVTVENLTSNPLPLQANLNDFITTGEEGGYRFEETKTNPLLTWTMINEKNFILAPKEKKHINLTITTPRTVPLGGYYGMLFLQPITPDNKAVLQVQSKVGVLILANIGVPDPKAKQATIETYSTELFPTNDALPMLLRVKNISLHFFTAKPILTISPLLPFSKHEESPLYLEDKIIFQQKIRRWEQEIALPKLQPNIYKARMSVSTGNGRYVTAESYFIIFPFAQIIIGTAIAIVMLFLLLKRKRLKKTFQALLSTHN